jgi:hypothetical protein
VDRGPFWSADGSRVLAPGAPVALFNNTRIYGGGVDNQLGRQYDVTRDGRFLINTVLDDVSGRSRSCRTGIRR